MLGDMLGILEPGDTPGMMIWAVAGYILGAAGAWAVARFGGLAGLLDFSSERSSHVGVVPKGGGVGILAAVVFSSAISGAPWLLWVPAAMVSIVSFVGDRTHLSPAWRLGVQFACAAPAALSALARPEAAFPLPVYPLLIIFIVAAANFANFNDGINGMAGIAGLIGFGLLFVRAIFLNDPSLELMVLAPACACLGFLPFNIPKAKVFMGDVGSVLLGFFLAVMALRLSRDMTGLAVTAAFFFPLFADAATTILVRKRDGERLTQAHRRHLYQLFANQGGVAHWKISAGYGLFQLLVGLAAWGAEGLGSLAVALVWLVAYGVFWVVSFLARQVYEAGAIEKMPATSLFKNLSQGEPPLQ